MKEILKNIGLNNKEIEIFIILFQNPSSSATQISSYTTIDRRTTYDILKKLYLKGFCSKFTKNKTTYYSSVSLNSIVSDLEAKTQAFKEIIPNLEELKLENNSEKIVELYSGRVGLVHITEDILKANDKHYVFGSIQKSVYKYPAQLKYFVNQLIKLNLKEDIIFEKGHKFQPILNGRYKFLPKEMIPPTTTIIYADKVAIFVNDIFETIILIKNKNIAKAYLSYFKTFWKIAKN